MNTPFSKWSCDQVCAWMEEFGLGQYVNMARQWVTSGQTLLSASSQDFEKVRDTFDTSNKFRPVAYINSVQVLTIWFPHSTPGGPCEMIWLCLSLQVVVVPITSWFGSTCQGGFNLCSTAVMLCDLLICSAVKPTQLNVQIWFSMNQNGYRIYVRLYASLIEHY